MARLTRLLNTRFARMVILVVVMLLCLINRPTRIDPKAAPTDFSTLPDFSEWPSDTQLPPQLVRQYRGSSGLDIDDRYFFVRVLGSGREGTVSLYQDMNTGDPVAIKAFHTKYRNPVPARLLEALKAEDVNHWPTEIPATLLLGGSTLWSDDRGSFPKRGLGVSSLDMLPALDYFLVRESPRHPASLTWHLATPYLGRGTLTDLAMSLEVDNQTPNDLDLSLRPNLHRLLGSLARMHRTGVVREAW
ncbi:MAG: hypothetical protein LQ344_004752 [Seirophora lacunosa]|nr:MAG: hypothetical protein LQ344_004752 [Seirophora lacunosa]